MTAASVQELLRHPAIWRGDSWRSQPGASASSGFAELDAELPGGGWPLAAVSEIVHADHGHGEMALLLPRLASLTQAGKRVLLIAPPFIPYAPAWQAAGVDLARLWWLRPRNSDDGWWAMEQALRVKACGAVLGWSARNLGDRAWRRLQLAAEQGGGHAFVLHCSRRSQHSSPVSLRLQVQPLESGWQVTVVKRRGSPCLNPILLRQAATSVPATQQRPLIAVVG